MRIVRAAAATTALMGLVACGAAETAGQAGSSPADSQGSPSTSEAASPGPPQTMVAPIPTPSAGDAEVKELAWREYFGAYVPAGSGGPMRTSKTAAWDFSHNEAGAVFAAAHFAATADARQPAKIWRPVISHAVPAGQRTATIKALKKANTPPPAEFDTQPYVAWAPNIRVVGFTHASVTANHAAVRVWARDDAGAWHVRHMRLAFSGGDWRLDLSKKLGTWHDKTPPGDMVAYSTV